MWKICTFSNIKPLERQHPPPHQKKKKIKLFSNLILANRF